MRPRLASLALLLLTLCSFSSVSAQGTNGAVNNKLFAELMNEAMIADLAKERGGDAFSVLHAVGAQIAKEKGVADEPMPDGVKLIADNGVQCAFDETGLDAAVKKAIYGTKPVDQTNEISWWKALTSKTIDCTSSTEPYKDCFCTGKNALIYCAGLKYKESIATTKGTCRKEAFTALKQAAPSLSEAFDYDKKDNAAEFFCEAMKQDVEDKVKALFKTELSYGFVEIIIGNLLFGTEGMQGMASSCSTNQAFKSTVFGACVCDQTGGGQVGVTFCLYKALGKEFEKQNFITCTNKPEAAAQLLPTDSNGPSNSASAISLLLAPLSAAAVLLMLRH